MSEIYTDTHAGQSKIGLIVQRRLFKLSSQFPQFRKRLIKVGELANYVEWAEERYPGIKKFLKREELWLELSKKFGQSEEALVLEFGVAYGYATNWWLHAVPHQNIKIHAFDRFTGLPRKWRDAPKGEFDTQGIAPQIISPHVKFHIGDVENTFTEKFITENMEDLKKSQIFILFDLDIFEPTKHVWDLVRPVLKSGDIVFFDEAFDWDERLVLNSEDFGTKYFQAVGMTPLGLGLKVK